MLLAHGSVVLAAFVFTPSSAEVATIQRCGEGGISDVLASRWKLTWNSTCTQEGDHTATPVPVWAWGPGNRDFAGTAVDNEIVGRALLRYSGG